MLLYGHLCRYNRDVEEQFNLASINDGAEVSAAVEDMPYDGSGTRTGQALEYVLDNLLVEANGDRPDVTNIVITITDGRSQVLLHVFLIFMFHVKIFACI